MPYRIWDNGIIRDATEAEIGAMAHIPSPYEDKENISAENEKEEA